MSKTLLRWLPLVLALVLVGGTSAYAQSTTINACYQKQTGSLRYLRAGQTCLNTEAPISWEQAGPQGPAGPAGVSGYARAVIATANQTVPPTGTVSGVALCPAGKQVLGGGGVVNTSGTVVLVSSGPVAAGGGASWMVQWKNIDPNPVLLVTLEINAICADVPAGDQLSVPSTAGAQGKITVDGREVPLQR